MFLNTASPRKSFSVPVNINLQGARRRQTREIFYPVGGQDQDWRRGGGERAKAQMPVSSVGEDRTVLLAFAMMAFAVLMFFVVGIVYVTPYLDSDWAEGANCSLVQLEVLEEWVDCRGVSTSPCLKVIVNISQSGQTARFHYDEESVLLDPQCFYIPKCQRDKTELEDEVRNIKSYLEGLQDQGISLPCLSDPSKHPEDAILTRKYTLRLALLSLLWPSLMLGGGTVLGALVKLTQYLARVCSEMQDRDSQPAAEGRPTSRRTQEKLYQFLRRRSGHSPMREDDAK